ncbi:MAG: hypothetical protein KKE20_03215 [Nanoarchaeota archaeon]|nr:hypothetical protein [Nanoarchaeota archaeon]
MIPKNLIKKTPSIENHNWKKVGERRSNSVLNRDLYAKGFGQKYIREMTGIDFGCKNLLFVNPELYLDVDEFAVFRDKFLENVRNDPEYYPLVVSRFRAYCDALKDLAYEIKEKDFSKAENADLKKQFERIMSALLDIMPFSYINHNQEEIPNILLEEVLIKAGVDKSRISEYKPKLIVPTDELTFSQQEAGALKELAEKLNKDNQKELIRQHIEEYGWIKSSYFNARQATEQEILERIKNINQAQEKHKENDPVLKELNIDENQLKVVNCLKELLFLKTYRKELIGLISFASKGLFDEIAKRMDVSYEHVINHTVDEIREFFASGKVNKDEIHKRLESFAHVLVDGHSKVITGSVLLEKYAEKGISQDITGQTANSGKVKGNVVVIEKQQDLKNIKQGSIVVIDSIGPTDFQHVSKAAGIITNHGGVLSHAALLARELNIPCIIGAENATQALEQGEYIELDADNGTVNKLEDKYRKMFTITMGLCLADLYMRTHVFNTREVLGKGHRNICFMIRDGKLSGYFSEEDIEEMGRLGVEKLKDNEFVQKNKS